jgi:flagellar basal-body rod protein FlgG
MLRGIYTAATGMSYQMEAVNTISHNLANVETNGYKRKELLGASFGDVLIEMTGQAPGMQGVVGQGIHSDGVFRFETPGNLVSTGSPLSFALANPGYFVVQRQDGTRVMTRDGDFSIDEQRRLITKSGELVLAVRPPTNQLFPVVLPGDLAAFKVAPDGSLTQGEDVLGRFLVVNPPEADMARFPLAPAQLQLVDGGVKQGFLEHSNVNVVTEMVSLMQANRAFGFSQKVVMAHDQMLQKAANDLGRVQ